jgi:hypothetical protein
MTGALRSGGTPVVRALLARVDWRRSRIARIPGGRLPSSLAAWVAWVVEVDDVASCISTR